MKNLKNGALNGLVNMADGVERIVPDEISGQTAAVATASIVMTGFATSVGTGFVASLVPSLSNSGSQIYTAMAAGAGVVAAGATAGLLNWSAEKIQDCQQGVPGYRPIKTLQKLGMAFGLAALLTTGGLACVETYDAVKDSVKKRAKTRIPAAAPNPAQKPAVVTYEV